MAYRAEVKWNNIRIKVACYFISRLNGLRTTQTALLLCYCTKLREQINQNSSVWKPRHYVTMEIYTVQPDLTYPGSVNCLSDLRCVLHFLDFFFIISAYLVKKPSLTSSFIKNPAFSWLWMYIVANLSLLHFLLKEPLQSHQQRSPSATRETDTALNNINNHLKMRIHDEDDGFSAVDVWLVAPLLQEE